MTSAKRYDVTPPSGNQRKTEASRETSHAKESKLADSASPSKTGRVESKSASSHARVEIGRFSSAKQSEAPIDETESPKGDEQLVQAIEQYLDSRKRSW